MDVATLKAEMVKHGYTQETLSKEIGISTKTFYNKLKKEDFGCKEIDAMIIALELKDPAAIFFTNKVT